VRGFDLSGAGLVRRDSVGRRSQRMIQRAGARLVPVNQRHDLAAGSIDSISTNWILPVNRMTDGHGDIVVRAGHIGLRKSRVH